MKAEEMADQLDYFSIVGEKWEDRPVNPFYHGLTVDTISPYDCCGFWSFQEFSNNPWTLDSYNLLKATFPKGHEDIYLPAKDVIIPLFLANKRWKGGEMTLTWNEILLSLGFKIVLVYEGKWGGEKTPLVYYLYNNSPDRRKSK